MTVRKSRRQEERKYKRFRVRFGVEEPEHSAAAIQISAKGLFISTNRPVFVEGTRLFIEIKAPDGMYTVTGVVRHAKRVPPQLVSHERPGMGVEFFDVPEDLRRFLDTL